MERKIILTGDGSHTVSIPEMNVTYHSHHGAVQESMHVFIRAGLHRALELFADQPLSLFEMGYGTGLNAFLTAREAAERGVQVHYTSVEQYPLSEEEASAPNYAATETEKELFAQLHHTPWHTEAPLGEHVTLRKVLTDLSAYQPARLFHLIYYDAFAPGAQPGLWTKEIFEKLSHSLHPGGLLVTYCSKGDVRRALQAAGFTVTKLPGPPGKREMVRAEKRG